MADESTDLIKRQRLLIFPGVAVGVFGPGALVIISFIVFGAAFTDTAGDFFDAVQDVVTDGFGWFYAAVVTGFLLFVIWIAVSSYGSIRLGMPNERPEFSYMGWFAMLFSAGMGIGLLFWSVAEPVAHFANPPTELAPGEQSSVVSMRYTFFHWGLHAWAVYIIMGLCLAYFAFRHQLPLAVRSLLYPVLGDRIYGPWGHLVDVFALFGTMFGVATSLGLGALQVNSGLNAFLGIEESDLVQTLIIAAITAAATVSVLLGLDAGIRRLSLFNIGAASILLAFVLLAGPTLFVLHFLFQAAGDYAQNLIGLSLWTDAVNDSGWQADWTWFYWGWWIAWSPFVGMFIARISRGRTIREFVTGVLLVPTGVTFAWLAIMGGTALDQEMAGNAGISEAVAGGEESTAVFVMLESLPLADITAALTVIVVAAFFVTSSDSGSFVIDMLASGGDPNPPRTTRVFWALLEGFVAAILLLAGGLTALRTASIASGLPIAVILVIVCYSLVKALRTEPIHITAYEREPPPPEEPYGTRDLDEEPGPTDG